MSILYPFLLKKQGCCIKISGVESGMGSIDDIEEAISKTGEITGASIKAFDKAAVVTKRGSLICMHTVLNVGL